MLPPLHHQHQLSCQMNKWPLLKAIISSSNLWNVLNSQLLVVVAVCVLYTMNRLVYCCSWFSRPIFLVFKAALFRSQRFTLNEKVQVKYFKICYILSIWKARGRFFVFDFVQLYFFPNECPGLWQLRPGHSIRQKVMLHKMKTEKNYYTYVGCLIHKL